MPVLRIGVGLCPALAVSHTLKTGAGMALATAFVLVASGALTRLLDRAVPDRVRLYCHMLVVGGLVTVVDFLFTRYTPGLHAALGIFIPLIAVNCMVVGSLGRRDGHGAVTAFLGDLGRGLGFAIALVVLSAFREILGSGGFWGRQILGEAVSPVPGMAVPAGALLAAGVLAGAVGLIRSRRTKRA
jgi:electron transport complex protein RnfE